MQNTNIGIRNSKLIKKTVKRQNNKGYIITIGTYCNNQPVCSNSKQLEYGGQLEPVRKRKKKRHPSLPKQSRPFQKFKTDTTYKYILKLK